MNEACTVNARGVSYGEEEATAGACLGWRTEYDEIGVDDALSIAGGAACSRPVDAVDKFNAGSAEVGSQKVSSYSEAGRINGGRVRLNNYVPSSERVNISHLHLVSDSGSGCEGPLLGRVNVEKACRVGGMDCC